MCGHQTYYTVTRSEDEAGYLTAVLNAPCLQQAFAQARRSDRDFMAHVWRAVPVPTFDPNVRLHRLLARLCTAAEQVAAGVMTGRPQRTRPESQVALSRKIRQALADDGVADRIDRAVRKLLPNHTTR